MPNLSPAAALLGAVVAVVVGCSSPGAPPPVAPADEPAGPPVFDDVTAASGIAFTYRNGEDANYYAIIESVGGGVALVDFDRDGWLDIFLPGGGHYAGKTVLGHPCRLFRNLGGFRFEDVTAKVGLDTVAFPYSHGAAAFDPNGDGWPDLLVTGYNRLVLLRNDPDGAGGRRLVSASLALARACSMALRFSPRSGARTVTRWPAFVLSASASSARSGTSSDSNTSSGGGLSS